MQSHLLNLGSRIEDYSDKPGLRFLIDVSRKSVTHWRHIIEQLDRIEALDQIKEKFLDKELNKLIA